MPSGSEGSYKSGEPLGCRTHGSLERSMPITTGPAGAAVGVSAEDLLSAPDFLTSGAGLLSSSSARKAATADVQRIADNAMIAADIGDNRRLRRGSRID